MLKVSRKAIAMHKIEKITIDGIRYMIWDEACGICPDAPGIRLLLSDYDGIGADELLVLPKNHPLVICAYTKDGQKTSVSDEARHAVSVSLRKSASPISETNCFHPENSFDYVEVRLTDCFCARLLESSGKKSRLAG